jgi:hypothetical protein
LVGEKDVGTGDYEVVECLAVAIGGELSGWGGVATLAVSAKQRGFLVVMGHGLSGDGCIAEEAIGALRVRAGTGAPPVRDSGDWDSGDPQKQV